MLFIAAVAGWGDEDPARSEIGLSRLYQYSLFTQKNHTPVALRTPQCLEDVCTMPLSFEGFLYLADKVFPFTYI